jgi:hypothetical protein
MPADTQPHRHSTGSFQNGGNKVKFAQDVRKDVQFRPEDVDEAQVSLREHLESDENRSVNTHNDGGVSVCGATSVYSSSSTVISRETTRSAPGFHGGIPAARRSSALKQPKYKACPEKMQQQRNLSGAATTMSYDIDLECSDSEDEKDQSEQQYQQKPSVVEQEQQSQQQQHRRESKHRQERRGSRSSSGGDSRSGSSSRHRSSRHGHHKQQLPPIPNHLTSRPDPEEYPLPAKAKSNSFHGGDARSPGQDFQITAKKSNSFHGGGDARSSGQDFQITAKKSHSFHGGDVNRNSSAPPPPPPPSRNSTALVPSPPLSNNGAGSRLTNSVIITRPRTEDDEVSAISFNSAFTNHSSPSAHGSRNPLHKELQNFESMECFPEEGDHPENEEEEEQQQQQVQVQQHCEEIVEDPGINTNNYDSKGRCRSHPHIQLRKKKLLGVSKKWKVLMNACPECCIEELRRIKLNESKRRNQERVSSSSSGNRPSPPGHSSNHKLQHLNSNATTRPTSPPSRRSSRVLEPPSLPKLQKKLNKESDETASLSSSGGSGESNDLGRQISMDEMLNQMCSKSSKKREGIVVKNMQWTDDKGNKGSYTGEVDSRFIPQGAGSMKYDNGSFKEGEWKNGGFRRSTGSSSKHSKGRSITLRPGSRRVENVRAASA